MVGKNRRDEKQLAVAWSVTFLKEERMAIYIRPINTLCLHIPKTGGNSIARVCSTFGIAHHLLRGKPPNQHAHARRSQLHVPADVTVAVTVRHPVAWYESHWRYLMGRGIPFTERFEAFGWHPLAPLMPCMALEFPTFIDRVIAQQPGFLTAMYAEYLPDADTIMRLESFAQDLGALLGIKPDRIAEVAPRNVSQGSRASWAHGQVARIFELEAETLRRFYDD